MSVRKLPSKYAPMAFAFYMAAIIAFMMCVFLTALNTGMDGTFISRVLKAYTVAMPFAFVMVLLFRPLVFKLTKLTVDSEER